MTTRKGNSKLSSVEALVAGDRDLMKMLMNEALEADFEGKMTAHLGAAPGEGTESRNSYRADYYRRGLASRIGRPAPTVHLRAAPPASAPGQSTNRDLISMHPHDARGSAAIASPR